MILAFKEANTKLCIYFCIIRRNHLPYCMNILVLHLILRCSELQADTKAKQSIILFYFYFAEWRTANAEHFLIANHRCVMKLFTSNNVNSEIKRRIIYNFVSSNDQAPLKVCTCIFAQLLLLFTERERRWWWGDWSGLSSSEPGHSSVDISVSLRPPPRTRNIRRQEGDFYVLWDTFSSVIWK